MRRWFSRSTLARQSGSYIVVGLLQLLVDWAVFVMLSATGLAVEPANVAGRISGAALGFWLNGRFTFAGEDTAVGRRQLARFLAMWLVTTAMSTWAMPSPSQTIRRPVTWSGAPRVR